MYKNTDFCDVQNVGFHSNYISTESTVSQFDTKKESDLTQRDTTADGSK